MTDLIDAAFVALREHFAARREYTTAVMREQDYARATSEAFGRVNETRGELDRALDALVEAGLDIPEQATP